MTLLQGKVSERGLAFCNRGHSAATVPHIEGRLILLLRAVQIPLGLENVSQFAHRSVYLEIFSAEGIEGLLSKAMGVSHVALRQLQIGEPGHCVALLATLVGSIDVHDLLVSLSRHGDVPADINDVSDVLEWNSRVACITG